MPLQLSEPDWDTLVGGTEESEWFADRNRKVDLISATVHRLRETHSELKRRDALYECSAEILRNIPFAADWYISLAGFAKKTLGNIREAPREFGLTRSAKGLVESLARSPAVPEAKDLAAFSEWINSELLSLYPSGDRNDLDALLRVSAILGGRVIGQGQNKGGDETVFVLKAFIVDQLRRGVQYEFEDSSGLWTTSESTDLATATRIRIGQRLVLDFKGGGDQPDIVIELDRETIVVGEVKGRKDKSNMWESWMPQVADHMRTWQQEYPEASRLFFGTLITTEMVQGVSIRGTVRTGLRNLYDEGALTTAYNLAAIVVDRPNPAEPMLELVGELRRLIGQA